MYLEELRLANIRGFSLKGEPVRLSFARPDGTYAGWTVIAGRNGTGKTTFLRAIALTLAGPTIARALAGSFAGWITQDAEEGFVHAAFSVGPDDSWGKGGQPPKRQPWAGLKWERLPGGPEPTMIEDVPSRAPKVTAQRGPWYENPSGWFVAGYGPFRRMSGAASEAQRLMLGHKRTAALVTLFDESASLAESLWWLQDVYPKSLEGDPASRQLLNSILKLLNDGLLPDEFRVERYDSDGLWVRREGIELALQEMSDGYRTVAALILDIVRRIYTAYGHFNLEEDEDGYNIAPYEGVVLIDEIDVHLHVSWQQQIGFWLRQHFPQIQFIVSTHSPFICQAASPRGLIRLPPPDEPQERARFIEDSLFNAIVNGGADRAVMSELFGLESPYSPEGDRLRRRLRALEMSLLDKGDDDALEDEIDATRLRIGATASDDVVAALDVLNEKLRRSDA